MMALSENFNEKTGVPHFDAAANEAHFANAHLDDNLNVYDNDVLARILARTGNEGLASGLAGSFEVNGGKAGSVNQSMAAVVDELRDDRSGSKEIHYSAKARREDKVEDIAQFERLELVPPPIHGNDDFERAKSDVCLILQEAGVPDYEIQDALKAGGTNNISKTMLAFEELAERYDVVEAQGYLKTLKNDMIEAKLLPQPQLAFAANDPKFDLEQRMQPAAARFAM